MVVGDSDNESTTTKNVGKLLAISIAMRMRWCNAGHIAQWSFSWASLKATGCRHRVSACIALPPRPPLSTNSVENSKHEQKTILSELTYGRPKPKPMRILSQIGPSTQLFDATSFVQMWNTTIGSEELVNISSYQRLSADKKPKSY